MLEEFGLTDNSGKQSTNSYQQPANSGQKKELALYKDDVRPLTEQEKTDFCRIKRIDEVSLERFRPYAHTSKPWVLLPAFSPGGPDKACGWLRCGMDGEPITIGDGSKVKYPIVTGSKPGLFGVYWLMRENPDTIIFCEAWRDALAAISIGLFATSSSGGASKWDDDWLTLFAGKKVYLCFGCDEAGVRALAYLLPLENIDKWRLP